MGTLIVTLNTDAGRLTAFRANQHHIRDVDRSFKLDTARVHLAISGLHLFLVLGADIYALYNHAAVINNHINNLATFAFIFEAAADHFHCIAFSNLYFHSSLLQHFRG
jgi:hypothetical protein